MSWMPKTAEPEEEEWTPKTAEPEAQPQPRVKLSTLPVTFQPPKAAQPKPLEAPPPIGALGATAVNALDGGALGLLPRVSAANDAWQAVGGKTADTDLSVHPLSDPASILRAPLAKNVYAKNYFSKLLDHPIDTLQATHDAYDKQLPQYRAGMDRTVKEQPSASVAGKLLPYLINAPKGLAQAAVTGILQGFGGSRSDMETNPIGAVTDATQGGAWGALGSEYPILTALGSTGVGLATAQDSGDLKHSAVDGVTNLLMALAGRGQEKAAKYVTEKASIPEKAARQEIADRLVNEDTDQAYRTNEAGNKLDEETATHKDRVLKAWDRKAGKAEKIKSDTRSQAEAYLKENRPDLYEKSPPIAAADQPIEEHNAVVDANAKRVGKASQKLVDNYAKDYAAQKAEHESTLDARDAEMEQFRKEAGDPKAYEAAREKAEGFKDRIDTRVANKKNSEIGFMLERLDKAKARGAPPEQLAKYEQYVENYLKNTPGAMESFLSDKDPVVLSNEYRAKLQAKAGKLDANAEKLRPAPVEQNSMQEFYPEPPRRPAMESAPELPAPYQTPLEPLPHPWLVGRGEPPTAERGSPRWSQGSIEQTLQKSPELHRAAQDVPELAKTQPAIPLEHLVKAGLLDIPQRNPSDAPTSRAAVEMMPGRTSKEIAKSRFPEADAQTLSARAAAIRNSAEEPTRSDRGVMEKLARPEPQPSGFSPKAPASYLDAYMDPGFTPKSGDEQTRASRRIDEIAADLESKLDRGPAVKGTDVHEQGAPDLSPMPGGPAAEPESMNSRIDKEIAGKWADQAAGLKVKGTARDFLKQKLLSKAGGEPTGGVLPPELRAQIYGRLSKLYADPKYGARLKGAASRGDAAVVNQLHSYLTTDPVFKELWNQLQDDGLAPRDAPP